MKGTSTLQVTEATIIAAVQMYLDDQFAAGKSPVVNGVKPRNGVGNGDGYSVTVEERQVDTLSIADELSAMREKHERGMRERGLTPEGANVGGDQTYVDTCGVRRWRINDQPYANTEDAYNKRMVGGDRHDG